MESGLRSAAQSERKILSYLLTDLNTFFKEGDVFSSVDHHLGIERFWLVLLQEVRTFRGYFRYKILELDAKLKYIDNSGKIKEVPAYLNGTGEFDIKEYFKFTQEPVVELPNRAINVIWAANPELNTETKFLIGDEVWRYVDSDKISIPGIYYSTIKKTARDEYNDSIEDQLAQIDKLDSVDIICSVGEEPTVKIDDTILQFFVLEDGEVGKSEVLLEFDEEFFIEQAGALRAIKEGASSVTVSIGSLRKTFSILTSETADYLGVVGDTKLRVNQISKLQVFASENFTYSFDNEFLNIKKQGDDLFVTPVKKGKTQIIFSTPSKTYEFEVEIKSLWVD